MHRNFVSLIVFISLSILAAGCSMHAAYTYPIGGVVEKISNEPVDVKIAVLPATDSRKTRNSAATWSLYLIPGMPYGWANYNRPEAAKMFFSIAEFEADLDEDLAKSIAKHWQDAGVAKRVFFDYGGLADTADYVLKTEIMESNYHGKIISYGLSAYGPALWIFGLPAGSSNMSLVLKMDLIDKAENTIWSETIKEKWGITQGLYYGMGRDMEGLALSLQKGLQKILRENPPPIKK